MREVFVVSGVRTAVGTFGGALKDQAPSALGTLVAKEAMSRAGIAPEEVGHVVFGQVIQTEPADLYLSRVVGVNAGIPIEVPAMTLNRLCGTGVQAILTGAQAIMLGDCDVVVAGGAETMSRAPYQSSGVRWGTRMGEVRMTDMLNGALSDPFDRSLMGVTAENVAERFGIDRDTQDEIAVESHRRASRATREGRFASQIVGVPLESRKGTTMFAEDEHIRHGASLEDIKQLRPVFKKEKGTVTAGNASGINDGAAAVVLASGDTVKLKGLTPLARLVAYGHAGVEPAYMGLGPIPATRNALGRAGLRIEDLDVIESNEAFAAQACAVARELGFDPEKVNPNGSGISIGHPVGATGAINVVKAVYELQRTGGNRALVTMCIGGGQGIAALFERC